MNGEKPVILMVEDEEQVLRMYARMLRRRGYEILEAADCARAQAHLLQQTPDLLVLDIMLPDGSGLDLCRAFRARSDAPVIFLTGLGKTDEKVAGLGMGADYYLTKPCDLEELAAVCAMLLQRHTAMQQKYQRSDRIQAGPLVLDTKAVRAWVDGRDVSLTKTEFLLLVTLAQNQNAPVSLEALYQAAWNQPSGGDTKAVRFHISNLKAKLGTMQADTFDIVAMRGAGYMLVVEPSP